MDAFSALADPTRREILQLLEQGPMDATAIAARFDISQPAVSKHLKRLREASLVSRSVQAQRRVYRLEPAGLSEIESWICARRVAWERRLDELETYVRRQSGKNP